VYVKNGNSLLFNSNNLGDNLMRTQHTYVLLFVAVAAVSSGLTYQVIDFSSDAPSAQADSSGIGGHLTATLYDEYGSVKAYRQTDNLIVDQGLDTLADLTFGTGLTTGESIIDYMKIGVGTTAPVAANTDIEDRTGVTTCTNATFTFIEGATGAGIVNVTSPAVAFLGSGGCNAVITEAGLFDAINGGNMFARQTFGGITVGSSDQLDITWSIQIADT